MGYRGSSSLWQVPLAIKSEWMIENSPTSFEFKRNEFPTNSKLGKFKNFITTQSGAKEQYQVARSRTASKKFGRPLT